MDEPDARLKAEHNGLQIDEVQRLSDTKKLQVYKMSQLSQQYFAWLLIGF